MSRPSWVLRPFLLPILLIAGAAHAEGEFDDVVIETTRINDSIAMLEGRGGNLGVCWGEDGVFLIDDQYAPLTPKILAAIAELSDQPVRFVLNTHWHGDHTGGNENMDGEGALLVSHANVRRRLAVDQFSAFFDRTTPALPDDALPVVTFTDSLTFHLNGQRLEVFHVPAAHTDGDGVVHFAGANVIHAGDIVFYGLYPYIDVSAGGGIDGVIAAVKTIINLCDDETTVIPGHGPVVGRTELQTYLAMLEGVREAVAAAMVGGTSLEDVQAAGPAAPWDAEWGQAWLTSDQFVELVYTSLHGS